MFKTVDDTMMEKVATLMRSLPIAPVSQVNSNFDSCHKAWGSMNKVNGNAQFILIRLRENLQRVTSRPGFSYWEASVNDHLPEPPSGANEVNSLLTVLTFVGKPNTYAYPHHIWRVGHDSFVLYPAEVLGSGASETSQPVQDAAKLATVLREMGIHDTKLEHAVSQLGVTEEQIRQEQQSVPLSKRTVMPSEIKTDKEPKEAYVSGLRKLLGGILRRKPRSRSSSVTVEELAHEIRQVSKECMSIHRMVLNEMANALARQGANQTKRQEVVNDIRKLCGDIRKMGRSEAANKLMRIADKLGSL